MGHELVRQERGHARGFGQAEPVAEPRLRERLRQPRDQVRRDRRPAVGDRAHAGDVHGGEGRLADRQPVDGRHRDHDVDALLGDGAQERADLEGRHDHRGAAGVGGQQELGVAAGHVEQRHRDQGAQGVPVKSPGQRPAAGLGVGQEVLVAGHGALGEARGTAGVEDRGRAGRAGVVDRERIAVRQRGARHEHVRRAGVGHHVVRFLLGEAGVDRHDDGIGQDRAEEGQHPVGAVAQLDRHPVAALDAEGAQPARHPGRAIPQLRVAQPGARRHSRRSRRRPRRRRGRRPTRAACAPGCGAARRSA